MIFAATDPSSGITAYLFTQGVLGVACVALIAVVIYFKRREDRLVERISEQQDLRLQDSRETAKEVSALAKDNSEAMRILTEKIEIARSKK